MNNRKQVRTLISQMLYPTAPPDVDERSARVVELFIAQEAIREIKASPEEAVPVLIEEMRLRINFSSSNLTKHDTRRTWLQQIHKMFDVLIEIGGPAIQDLVTLLEDGNPELRRYGALALGSIGQPAALIHLERAWRDEDDQDTQDCMSYAMQRIEMKAKSQVVVH